MSIGWQSILRNLGHTCIYSWIWHETQFVSPVSLCWFFQLCTFPSTSSYSQSSSLLLSDSNYTQTKFPFRKQYCCSHCGWYMILIEQKFLNYLFSSHPVFYSFLFGVQKDNAADQMLFIDIPEGLASATGNQPTTEVRYTKPYCQV